MNRRNPNHPLLPNGASTNLLMTSSTLLKPGPQPMGRLLVLVSADSNYEPALRRIWQLAAATSKHVQLLGLCKDTAQELSLRRQLVLMSALVGDSRISTEAKVELGANWVDLVKRSYQRGDIIICFAEQRDGGLHKSLNQLLEENLDAPILILSSLHPQHQTRLNLLSRISLWAGLIGISAGAFLFQIRIQSLPREWAPTILLILSVMAEFWLIWVWNKLFS